MIHATSHLLQGLLVLAGGQGCFWGLSVPMLLLGETGVGVPSMAQLPVIGTMFSPQRPLSFPALPQVFWSGSDSAAVPLAHAHCKMGRGRVPVSWSMMVLQTKDKPVLVMPTDGWRQPVHQQAPLTVSTEAFRVSGTRPRLPRTSHHIRPCSPGRKVTFCRSPGVRSRCLSVIPGARSGSGNPSHGQRCSSSLLPPRATAAS